MSTSQQLPDRVDVVVIGAGPVGENVAQYAHDGGLSALIVEHELVGGECSYYACMPSKALLVPIEVAGQTQNLPGVPEAAVDVPGLLARRDVWVHSYDDASQVEWAEGAGITLVRGHARLVGERRVSIDGVGEITADKAVVLATGSAPVIPDAFEGVEPWTSRDATGVVEVPERLLVIGGGVVAVEAATWMAGLGSKVIVLVRGEKLLSRFEEGVGEAVLEGLQTAGVEVVFGVDVDEVTRESAAATGLGRVHGGAVQVRSGVNAWDADEVLVATGRRPRLDAVGLDSVGLAAEDVTEGRVPEWLFAVGDAGPGAPLTHMGKYEARVLGSKKGRVFDASQSSK